MQLFERLPRGIRLTVQGQKVYHYACRITNEIDVLENYVLACGVRGKSAWDKKWVRLPKHKAGYDLELLNQSREYIMELLKPVYQVVSDKKSTVKDYVLAIYKLIVLLDIPDKLAKKEQALLDAGDQTASKEWMQRNLHRYWMQDWMRQM